jgi:glutamine amidotransferase
VITVVDIGISNLKSITRGFAVQGFGVRVTADPGTVRTASCLVLPGVGAFPKAVERLRGTGLFDAVRAYAAGGGPLLGVCLGMQLLMSESEEHARTPGLDLIRGRVRRFPPGRHVPHMGWNELVQARPSFLLEGIPDRADFYFVHSYFAEPEEPACVTGRSDYGGLFAAAVQAGRVFGVQFHPEKSQDRGLRILQNFALLAGERPA